MTANLDYFVDWTLNAMTKGVAARVVHGVTSARAITAAKKSIGVKNVHVHGGSACAPPIYVIIHGSACESG